MTIGSRHRDRDAIAIAGDYQARALESPWAARRFWHAAKIRQLDRLLPPRPSARVADVGCGSGVIARHLAARAGSVVGLDANPDAVGFAQAAYRLPNLRFVLGPLEQVECEGPFDQLVCLEVIEHLYPEQADATLALLSRAAAPGADLFVTTPNQRSAWPLIEWLLDQSGLVPTLDQAQHLTFFHRRSLSMALERAGWQITEMGTFNGMAPFAAPLGETVARAIERAEFRARHWAPWNLLYCLARRR